MRPREQSIWWMSLFWMSSSKLRRINGSTFLMLCCALRMFAKLVLKDNFYVLYYLYDRLWLQKWHQSVQEHISIHFQNFAENEQCHLHVQVILTGLFFKELLIVIALVGLSLDIDPFTSCKKLNEIYYLYYKMATYLTIPFWALRNIAWSLTLSQFDI